VFTPLVWVVRIVRWAAQVDHKECCLVTTANMGSSGYGFGMTRLFEPEKPPPVAVVEDLCDIAIARLRDDYGGEMKGWTFLGYDVARLVLKPQ